MGAPADADRPRNGHGRTAANPTDGLYDLPLVGSLIERADRLRATLPRQGLAHEEADFLRLQAKALRLAANALDVRARQLERVAKGTDTTPRIERIRVD